AWCARRLGARTQPARPGPGVPQQPRHPGRRHLRQRRQDPVGRHPRHPQRLPAGAAGTYHVEVKVAPSTTDDPAALEADVRLGSRPTTIAAIGSLTGDGGPLQLKVVRDRDTVSRYLTPLRVAHPSPDAPAVDVQVKLAGRWYRVVRGLEFGEATGYLLLPAWSYRLRIVAAGPNPVVKGLGKGRLGGSTSYTAWAVGFLTPTGSYPGFDVFVSKDG